MSVLTNLINVIERLAPGRPVTDDQWLALNNHIPEPKPTSLSDVNAKIPELEAATPRVSLVAILACLKGPRKLDGTPETAGTLGSYAAAAIAPCSRVAGGRGGAATGEEEDYDGTVQRVGEVAAPGLEILRICSDEYAAPLSQDALLTLVSFTDAAAAATTTAAATPAQRPREPSPPPPPHPWVPAQHATAAAAAAAGRVLAQQLARRGMTADALAATALRDYLRPLFSRARPGAVTAAGRMAPPQQGDAAAAAAAAAHGLRDVTGAVKPWKYVDHRAIAVFRWAVHAASETLIRQQWPMFIPVLLTLLDDSTTRVRSVGLAILPAFLRKFPDRILHDTGLASVFEDAVFPTLHFLPSITPEAESIQLLTPAYQSLLVLSRKLEPRARSGPSIGRTPRAHLLDRLLRDGVFSGYSHAKEHARVAALLFRTTAKLVHEMGVHSAKHLKDLIPMHCEVLTDPFAVAAPQLLEGATHSLSMVLSTCWPRLDHPPYQDELIKALVICFLNVHDDPASTGKLKPTQETLILLASMLSVAGGGPLQDKVRPLIAKEPVLELLFSVPR